MLSSDLDALLAPLQAIAAQQPHRLLFASVSGAHLYGFPAPDSAVDVRGVHVLPLTETLGLMPAAETLEERAQADDRPVDWVTHDLKKFALLLLKANGQALEQLYSPLAVRTTVGHQELQAIAKGCATRNHCDCYLGLARSHWRRCETESPPRVKSLLYVYRGLLTGIHLMQTGEVEANLALLNDKFRLPAVGDLVARQRAGPDTVALEDGDRLDFHRQAYERLCERLEWERDRSQLPLEASARPALNDWLVRVRLATHRPRNTAGRSRGNAAGPSPSA